MKAKKILCLVAILSLLLSATADAQISSTQVGGIRFDVIKCMHYGKGVAIALNVTNTTDNDLSYAVEYDVDGNMTSVIGEDGIEYEIRSIFAGNRNADCCGGMIELPSGVKMKFTVYTREVPEKLSLLRQFTMDGRFKGSSNKTVVLRNIPIEELSNTDAPNMKLTCPLLEAKSKPLVRRGNNVEQDFTMTLHGDETWEIGFKKITVYDSDGNSYTGVMTRGAQATIEPDIPKAFRLTIHNVPERVTEFSLIRAEFGKNHSFKVEWKRQKVEAKEEPLYKSGNEPRCLITKVECTEKETILHFEYTTEQFGGWVRLSPQTYIVGQDGRKHQIIKADGIPFAPKKQNYNTLTTIDFTMTFPAVMKGTTYFDMIEPGGWEFYGIKVTK